MRTKILFCLLTLLFILSACSQNETTPPLTERAIVYKSPT